MDLRLLLRRRMSVSLLGDDGRGYELARRLEGCGAWRSWLGDSAYSSFVPSLSSPSAWDSFMSPPNQDQIHLQLRTRALLFDKASISLFLNPSSSSSSSSSSISHLNPQCKFHHHHRPPPRVFQCSF